MRHAIAWMTLLTLGQAGLALAEVAPAVLQAEAERVGVIAKAKPSVLAIFSADGGTGGSGVLITPDGYALTNFHVVKPCGNAMKCGTSDGRLYDAVIVGLDPTGDVALIKLLGRDDFPYAEMADSDQVQPGDWVFALGNPFMLATDFQPTVTYGIISGVHRYQYPSGTLLEYADCLQTDASINPGSSGGPLLDSQGRLIAINGRASFEKRGRVNVGAAYAISINQIKNFLGDLRGGRIVDHATLGARVGSDDLGRVVVTDILQQSDAFRRGLRYGDEIVSFASRSIETPNAFKNVLGILPKGWRVPLSFRRDGKRYDVLVRLQGVHAEGELIEKAMGRPPVQPVPVPVPMPGDQPRPAVPKPDKAPRPKTPPNDEQMPGPKPHGPPKIETLRAQPTMPALVQKHFEAKRGYANYYFNQLNRDRVWKLWTARAGFTAVGGPWTISGRLPSGSPLAFRLTGEEALLKLPASQWKWSAPEPPGASLLPPGSGGLLLALHLWRRLAVEGPGRFGEVYYLGTAPLAGHEGLLDVLVGLHAGVECRFMFDPAEGFLLALEMFPGEDVDPCEVYFSDYREIEGRWLPQRMEVRFGDEQYAAFELGAFQLESSDNHGDAQ